MYIAGETPLAINIRYATNGKFSSNFCRESRDKKKKFRLPQAKLSPYTSTSSSQPPFLSFFPHQRIRFSSERERLLNLEVHRSATPELLGHISARPLLFLHKMLRMGMRRCAPIRRAHLSIPAMAQCQARVTQVAQKVAVLPPLRSAFHVSRVLSQFADADAPAEQPDAAAYEGEGMEQFMAFEDSIKHGVHPNLVRAVTHDMKYQHMSEIQERTLEASLKGKDM